MIGVDMGLSTHLTFSNGEKVSSVVGETDRLKRLSKKLARQTKGSNNHTKTKHLIRKQHQKLVNKRDDIANKVVHQLLLNETVFIQNVKPHRLEKKPSEAHNNTPSSVQ